MLLLSLTLNSSLIKKLLVPALFAFSCTAYSEVIEITDIAERSVSLDPDKIENIVLGEGRLIYTLALLNKENPLDRVVGWKDDLIKYDPDAYRKYLKVFLEIAKIENLGSPYTGDYSLEKIITLNTDLLILNLGNLLKAQESGLLTKLDKAGIKVVFVDLRQRPTQNTVPSLLMLGKVLILY